MESSRSARSFQATSMSSVAPFLDTERLEPVGTRFRALSRYTFVIFSATAVAGFALTVRHALHSAADANLVELAGTFADATIPDADGDFSDCMGRLQARSDRLVALGVIGIDGQLSEVLPDRPAHRQLVQEVLAHPATRLRVPSPTGNEPLDVFGVVASPRAGDGRRFAVVLRVGALGSTWLAATAIFTCLVFLGSVVAVQGLSRWFDRRVVRPLREMGETAADPATFAEGLVLDHRAAWKETAIIAARFDELLRSLASADARTRRVERESEQHMMRKKIGFDRELRRAKDRVYLDALTGLKNRLFLEEQIETILESHRIRNCDLCAVMIDLDNFKNYNDTLGHQVGDALIRFAGALLRGSIRPTDYAVRYGGDEFLLLLPDADAKQSSIVSERIIKLFGQYANRLGKGNAVSMSAGVASWRESECKDARELIAKADAALYVVKRSGKNQVAVYQPSADPIPAVPVTV